MNKTLSIATALMSCAWIAACAAAADVDADAEAKSKTETEAEQRGDKSDRTHTGTCRDACDEQSSGGCWCDEQCVKYDDCCEDYRSVCVAGSGGAGTGSGGSGGAPKPSDWRDDCPGETLKVNIVGIGKYNDISDAVKSAPAGATIQVCPGTYGPIAIERNVTLIGADQATTFISSSAQDGLSVIEFRNMDLENAVDVTIEGFTIDQLNNIGRGIALSDGLNNGYSPNKLTVRDCRIKNTNVGVYFRGGKLTLDNTQFTNNTKALDVVSGEATLNNNHFENNKTAIAVRDNIVTVVGGSIRKNHAEEAAVDVRRGGELYIKNVDFGAGQLNDNTPLDIFCESSYSIPSAEIGWLGKNATITCKLTSPIIASPCKCQ